MANFRYFAEHNGQTVQLANVFHDGAVATSATHFTGAAPDGTRIQATRRVEYKANPSKHECDARCLHATGKVMKCECACGGKNHGRGN